MLLIPPNDHDDDDTTATATTAPTTTNFPPAALAFLKKILTFTASLLNHSYNKHVYNSHSSLALLLSSSNDSVAHLALEGITALAVPPMVHRQQSPDVSPHQTPLHNSATLSSKLLLLSRGWGTSSTSLSLAACISPSEEETLPDDPNTLRFDFYAEKGTAHNVVLTPEELKKLGSTENVYR